MVCCDRCQNWFHSSCVGIHRKSMLKTIKTFYCIACCDELGKNYPHSWQSGSEKLAVKLLKKPKRKMVVGEDTGASPPERQKPRAEFDAAQDSAGIMATAEIVKPEPTASSLSSSTTTQPDQAASNQPDVTANEATTIADASGMLPGAIPIPYAYPAAGFPYAMGAVPNMFYYPQYPAPHQQAAPAVTAAKPSESSEANDKETRDAPKEPAAAPSQPWVCAAPLPAQPVYPAMYPYVGYVMVPPPAPAPAAAAAAAVPAESSDPAGSTS
jgi:hypothetical protein